MRRGKGNKKEKEPTDMRGNGKRIDGKNTEIKDWRRYYLNARA